MIYRFKKYIILKDILYDRIQKSELIISAQLDRDMLLSKGNSRLEHNNQKSIGRNSSTSQRHRGVAASPAALHVDNAGSSSTTLLPTTFSPSANNNNQLPHTTSKQSPRYAQQLWGNNCSTFLLGGTYYPGKDKKRRQLKRRTLWYRLFCSSPWRKLLSFVLIGYLLCFHVLRPLASHIFDYGRIVFPRRRNGLHWTWLLFDESLLEKIGSVEDERAEALRLVDERQRLQFGSEQRHAARLKTLERIVPGWYHRNDEHAEQNKIVEEKLREAERMMEEREPPRKKDDESHREEVHTNAEKERQRKNTNNQKKDLDHLDGNHLDVTTDNAKEKRRPTNSSSEYAAGVRTLDNMHLFRNKSSCPLEMDLVDIRVTLVIQSTQDRLWILKRTCQRWTDPITLVLFLDSVENATAADATIAQNGDCPQLTIVRHIMDSSLGENGKDMYPVNRLRNLGLDVVQTSHVLMTDIDFVPSEGLVTKIRAALMVRNSARKQDTESSLLPSEEREALVVPAFERITPAELCQSSKKCEPDTLQALRELSLPKSFDELRSCVKDRKECRVFQSHNNWDGHSSTRSDAWLDGKWYNEDELSSGSSVHDKDARIDLVRIRTLQCFDSVRYEPYVVLRWCSSSKERPGPVAPYYDERFHGYGKNKIELISHLRVMGYSFSILPEGFIIHAPHSISKAKRAWESTKESNLHSNMDHLYPKFLKELVAKYKHEHHGFIKQC